MYGIETTEFFVSRDAQFSETDFPFAYGHRQKISSVLLHGYVTHIEIDCHFVRDVFVLGDIRPNFVPTNEQLADIFTKALENNNILFYFASWAFEIFTVQSEEDIVIIVYLYYIYIYIYIYMFLFNNIS